MKATSVDLKIRTTNGYISVEAAIAVAAAAVAVAAVEQSLQSAVTKTTSNNTLDLQIRKMVYTLWLFNIAMV